MKMWQLTAPSTLNLVEGQTVLENETDAKIKITKVGLSRLDQRVLLGEEQINYPVVPCRQAVGIVSETQGGLLSRGQRVVFQPYVNCGACPQCKASHPESCERLKILGLNEDGLLRDFVVFPQQFLYHLPDHVKDNDALFVDHIALALSAISKLGLQKGEYLAIVGAGITGTCLAQAALYYQAIPILIDSHDERLQMAQNLGIYYTINTNNGDLIKKMRTITGGKMCECVAYNCSSEIESQKSFELGAKGGRIAFLGWRSDCEERNTFDLSPVLDKRLTVFGLNHATHMISNAINMLANKVIDISGLVLDEVAFADFPQIVSRVKEKVLNLNKIIVKI